MKTIVGLRGMKDDFELITVVCICIYLWSDSDIEMSPEAVGSKYSIK